MPPSNIRPEDSYAAFHTTESVKSVAQHLGVMRLTLRRWWIAEFGLAAYDERVHRKVSEEAKKERRKAYRKANASRIRTQKKVWNASHPRDPEIRQAKYAANRDQHRAYNNAYYASNAEKLRADARQYRVDHREQVRAKEKGYYVAHPEKLLLKLAKKRSHERGLPFSITASDILAVIPADGRCPIIRELFVRGEGKVCQTSMTLDRIKPELGYIPGNIAVISHLANTIKQNCTDPEVFRRLALYLEEHPLGKVA
jgi:hypothetical protein